MELKFFRHLQHAAASRSARRHLVTDQSQSRKRAALQHAAKKINTSTTTHLVTLSWSSCPNEPYSTAQCSTVDGNRASGVNSTSCTLFPSDASGILHLANACHAKPHTLAASLLRCDAGEAPGGKRAELHGQSKETQPRQERGNQFHRISTALYAGYSGNPTQPQSAVV